MVRALYAAENARTQHELTREREKTIALRLQNETLSSEAGRLVAENQDLHTQINEMSTEAADLRSGLRRADLDLATVRETLRRVEIATAAKDVELEDRAHRIGRLVSDIDHMRIEAMSRDTEIDTLKTRIQFMRDEREDLRRENKLLVKRAKDAEIRLAQEEHKVLRLEDSLARDAADRADTGSALERRQRELADLRAKLKATNAQLRSAQRSLKQAGLPLPEMTEDSMPDEQTPAPRISPELLENDIRHRQTALTERLLKATSSAEDEKLREELGDIAAKMILLTSMRESVGEGTSPLTDLMAQPNRGSNAPRSLVDRVMALDPSAGRASQPSPAE
jgi:chromosome segregation ATPase